MWNDVSKPVRLIVGAVFFILGSPLAVVVILGVACFGILDVIDRYMAHKLAIRIDKLMEVKWVDQKR